MAPTLFGLIAAGLRPALANSSYTPRELAHQMKDSGVGMIFVHPDLFPVVIETFTHLGIPNDQARGRVVIMSHVDQDHAGEKAAKIGSEWTRLRVFFGDGKPPSEELYCWGPSERDGTPVLFLW
jgi:4-coumarate--CoA ligase